VKAFNVTKFIGMYEVKGGRADELMRFVACLYFSGFAGVRMERLTKKFADGLCHENPAGRQARRESGMESGVGVVN
jgi:hypothetical protein